MSSRNSKVLVRICAFICGFVLLCGILLVVISPWIEFAFNISNSLPGKLYVICKDARVTKGDTVAFYWQGGVAYPAGTIFIKRVAGIAGDVVRRHGHHFWVNNQYIGIAKPKTLTDIPLVASPGGVIEPGSYFVATPHPNSIDSRYAIVGNVYERHIIGRAYVVF